MKSVYLDHAATTPMAKPVIAAMTASFEKGLGNSSSAHAVGHEAAARVKLSRGRLADRLGVRPEEIAFTSGGSESNNWVLQRVVSDFARTGKKPHIITSMIEHSSVNRVAEWLKAAGLADWDQVEVDSEGFVTLKRLRLMLRSNTALVSIVHGNNEIATIQPLEKIGTICRENNVLFHSDICQSFGHHAFNLGDLPVDFASISSHKIRGPKGIGALYIRKGIELSPLMFGGTQEYGKRPGTSSIELMEGFAVASELWNDRERTLMRTLRDEAVRTVLRVGEKTGKQVVINGPKDSEKALCHVLSFTLPEISSVDLGQKLSATGVYCSNGSACTSGKKNASAVLLALGRDEKTAHQLRVSFSVESTVDDLVQLEQELVRLIQA